jgi:excisionase family DNA binding protein
MFSINTNKPDVLNNLISVKNAASYSGYSRQYVRRLLRTGQLSGLKIGQLWLIDKLGFDQYLEKGVQSKDRRFGPNSRSASI